MTPWDLEEDANGYYSLCVFNADTVSDEEVIKTFEEFGSVLFVNRCKNLVFIRYANYEEAVKCLERMKSHPVFKVKPAKQKMIPDKNDSRSRNAFNGHRKSAEKSNWKNGSNNSFQSTEKESPMETMPDLKYDEPEHEADAAVIAGDTCYQVIVAHIPPNMLQCDIYRLCFKTQAEPLHVEMKSFTHPPYPPIHYAIVYVKSTEEVDNIVRGLNNRNVHGFQTVAAAYEKLTEEGMNSQNNK